MINRLGLNLKVDMTFIPDSDTTIFPTLSPA